MVRCLILLFETSKTDASKMEDPVEMDYLPAAAAAVLQSHLVSPQLSPTEGSAIDSCVMPPPTDGQSVITESESKLKAQTQQDSTSLFICLSALEANYHQQRIGAEDAMQLQLVVAVHITITTTFLRARCT